MADYERTPLEPLQSRRRPKFAALCYRAVLGAASIPVLLLLPACSESASGKLLASELFFHEQKDGWVRTIEIDPKLASRPEIVRLIRSERIDGMQTKGMQCIPTGSKTIACEEHASYELHYDGKRLVSVYEETYVDSGGAHGNTAVADHLFDLEAGREIRFGDLFISWQEAQPVLQRAFCEDLRQNYDDVEACPEIQKQAITLYAPQAEMNSGATSILVNTQDYALGSYAAGQATILIDVTPKILDQIKSEYRPDFAATASAGAPANAKASGEAANLNSDISSTSRIDSPVERGIGSCKQGDPLEFAGGWALGGAQQMPFSNPVSDFEDFLALPEATQNQFAAEDPLRFVGRGLCTGAASLSPRTVYLSRRVQDGRFLIVGVDTKDRFDRSYACQVIIQSSDVSCVN